MLISLIAKVSKLCNLRCVYCYETPELANPERMSHENIRKMFLEVRDFIARHREGEPNDRVEFIWHGGEPFAQSVSYWEEILRLQDEILGSVPTISLLNNIQTNLTLIRKEHLGVLRRFRVGCSFDVYNNLRVDAQGKETAAKVRNQLDWLKSEGIDLGGICVISRVNVDHPNEIAEFFLSRGMSFRALNIYQAKDLLPQIRESAVSFDRYLQFYTELYKNPSVQRGLGAKIWIDPLATSKRMLEMWKKGMDSPLTEDQCFEKEWALMVNTNGDVYSPGDSYNTNFRYGNIFSQTLEQLIFDSEGRKARIARSIKRMQKICKDCFLFRRGCNGTYVSHATEEEYREFERVNGCYQKLLAEMMKRESQSEAAPEIPLPNEVLYLNLTFRCNSRCLFCAADVAYKTTPRQLSLAEINQLLSNKRYLQVQLSGGEPTIHPDILEIVRLCRQRSDNVALLTHGRSFHNKTFAENVLRSGVNSMIVPLYGPDPKTHDYVAKVKGSFDQTILGFENLGSLKSRYNFRIELKLLLTRFTAPLNTQIYELAKQRFASTFDQISICPLIYSQSTLDYKDEFLAPFAETRDDLFSLARRISREGIFRLRLNEFPPCFFPEDLRGVAHPMLHQPVVHLKKLYGDDQSSERIVMNANAEKFRTTLKGNILVKKCASCVFRDYCSERETPFFSHAYLDLFGEREFNPILDVPEQEPATVVHL